MEDYFTPKALLKGKAICMQFLLLCPVGLLGEATFPKLAVSVTSSGSGTDHSFPGLSVAPALKGTWIWKRTLLLVPKNTDSPACSGSGALLCFAIFWASPDGR